MELFTKIILENFLSFQHVEFDLTDSTGKPKNIAIIYGENGSGKSNLAMAFQFLNRSVQTMSFQKYFDDVFSHNDSSDISKERLVEMLNGFRLDKMVETCRTFQTVEPMRLMFQFMISDRLGQYEMTFNENQITGEILRFQLESRMSTLFSYNNNFVKIGESLISNKAYAKDVSKKIERYFGKHSFLAMMLDEFEKNNDEFMKKALNPVLQQIIDEFFTTSILCHIESGIDDGYCTSLDADLLNNLEEGIITKEKLEKLGVFERALNEFFLPLYTDIKKIHYVTKMEDEKYRYFLYFSKQIFGKIIEIPYDHESTGTRKLLQLFPYLFEAVRGSNVVIDEMDTGIHDILVSTVIENACRSVKGQLILTTHNTTLLETLKEFHDIFYVIDTDAYGHKEILSIGKSGSRMQKNHNPRNRYLDGMIGGIPIPGYFDLEGIVQEAESTYDSAKS